MTIPRDEYADDDDEVDPERLDPSYYRGEHVYDMDEGDPEQIALAEAAEAQEKAQGLEHSGNRRYVDPDPADYPGADDEGDDEGDGGAATE